MGDVRYSNHECKIFAIQFGTGFQTKNEIVNEPKVHKSLDRIAHKTVQKFGE